MSSLKDQLKKARLYLVLDRQVNGYHQLWEILKQSVGTGVDILQLRDKTGSGREILQFSQKTIRFLKGKIPYILNDRVDLAVASRASGVHLGQEDLPIQYAKKMLGKSAIIGISCQTYRHALDAQKAGADYIGFGSVFKTQTKPDRDPMDLKLLADVVKKIRIPVFAIGGIHLDNIRRITELGVRKVAVCRAICSAQDIAGITKEFRKVLTGLT